MRLVGGGWGRMCVTELLIHLLDNLRQLGENCSTALAHLMQVVIRAFSSCSL